MNTIRGIVILLNLHLLLGCTTGPSTVPGVGWSAEPKPRQRLSEVIVRDVDSDGDGVLDSEDMCKGSAENRLVDDKGCEVSLGVIEGLDFGPNDAELSVDSRTVLSKIVSVLRRYPRVVVTISAHTDNRGTAADNLELSKQRVLSVVRYMVFNGIAADRIKPYAFGEGMPLAANATPEGREQNRRIEIHAVEGLL